MKNSDKIILDLCGGTGAWSEPYKKAGYRVFLITLPEYDVTQTEFGNANSMLIFKHRANGFPTMIRMNEVHGILAAPPCTMFSLARNNAKTPRDFVGAMLVVRACLEIVWFCRTHGNLQWWALENPKAYLRQFLGRPAYSFEAWWFGDQLKKPTDLWGYFNEPTKKRGAKKPTYPRKGPGSWSYQYPNPRAKERSITPQGFAQAFFKANQ